MADKPHEFTDFPIEFYNEINDDPALYDEADARLRRLAKDHTDMVGAMVTIRPSDKGSDHDINATVTVYTSPNYLNATVESRQAHGALKGALDAIERQVREMREKLRGY
jgi:ribosome-associated translation inhibitor RaiA